MVFAFRALRGAGSIEAQTLAQQHGRANGGRFQVSLGPRRSHRSGEASSTIHCTSSSNVMPANAASSGTSDVLVHAGLDADLKAKEATCSRDALVEAEIRTAHAPAAKRQMRRQR
jgi:hypothetical protein